MSAKDMDPPTVETPTENYTQEEPHQDSNNSNNAENERALPPSYVNTESNQDFNNDLGPLPSNWEKAYTEKGEIYFIE